jgi:pimeloyl-ACP methyl ester carboxylesterase
MSSTHEFLVDGVRQVYHVAGTGPVCVAHSGGPGIDSGYLRAPGLEEHFTMVYLEPVGTGDSGRLGTYDLATYVRFLSAVADHLEAPTVNVLGHSYGGFVALRYALEHPDRVSGLALYDTSPLTGPDFWGAAMAGLAAYPGRFPDVPEAAEVPAAFQRAVGATDDETLSAGLRAAIAVYFADYWARRAEFQTFTRNVRAWAAPASAQDPLPYDVTPRLGEIVARTAVVAGAHDFICGPRWARMLADGIPGARLTILEDSGHFGHIEQPAEFTAAVVSALLG